MKCCAKHIHNKKKMAKIHAWNFLFINADKLFGELSISIWRAVGLWRVIVYKTGCLLWSQLGVDETDFAGFETRFIVPYPSVRLPMIDYWVL